MTGPEIIVAEVLSYELWVYGAFILLPILYGVLFCHIRCRIKPKVRVQLIEKRSKCQSSVQVYKYLAGFYLGIFNRGEEYLHACGWENFCLGYSLFGCPLDV